MKNKLTEKDCDIICDALDSYVNSEEYPLYSKPFSDDEVEKTFYKVEDLWRKLLKKEKKPLDFSNKNT
jgi:hypothetical protein